MKTKWQPIVKIKASLLFQWYWIKGSLEETPDALDIDFRYKNNKIVADEISIDINEAINVEQILTKRVQKSSTYLDKYINRCYQYSKQLLSTSKRLGRKELSKLSNNQLLLLYLEYQGTVLKLMPFLNTILVLDEVLKKEITKLFADELGIEEKDKQDILLSKLVIPKKKSFFVEETESLLNIALKLQKHPKADITEEIKEYLNRFAWTSSISYLGDFQKEKDVKKRVEELVRENPEKRIKEQELIRKKTQADFKEAYKRIEKSKQTSDLVDFAREFIYLLTYRLDVFFIAHYNIYPLFKEIGGRFNFSVEDLVYLTGDEIQRLLGGRTKIKSKEINNRKDSYALILENGKWQLLSGLKVKKVKQKAVKESVVKGTVASRGRVTGTAKLIFDVEEIEKVNRGDIIVSPMTRPEYTPAIIKASGIITDFGGMLSHAAIISREFGIPCIVGTNNATKVFKDKDKVELNAYEGIARKLEEEK